MITLGKNIKFFSPFERRKRGHLHRLERAWALLNGICWEPPQRTKWFCTVSWFESWFKSWFAYRIQCCYTRIAGPSNGNLRVLRSNDDDHLQNRERLTFREGQSRCTRARGGEKGDFNCYSLCRNCCMKNRLCCTRPSNGLQMKYSSDNWNEQRKATTTIDCLALWQCPFRMHSHRLLTVPIPANWRSTCLRTVYFYSLLFTCMIFFFHAIDRRCSFCCCMLLCVDCRFVDGQEWILLVNSRAAIALFRRRFDLIYIATWTE